MILFTGRGTLTFDGIDELDDVAYYIEVSHRNGFQRARIILGPDLAKLVVAKKIVLTLTIEGGRTLRCRMIDEAGEVRQIAGGTF